ncbi:hypothetical protein [Aquihabitans sp. McL0605]|uniref:hypothetical protein n=1 Tax=Aquihabitans sp. McL0605 TaxID=3415671 RepID=UPI003CF5F790
MKRRDGRENWWRPAGLVLVAIVAAFSLPSGVLGPSSSGVHRAEQAQLQRAHPDASTIAPRASRRPWSGLEVHLPAAALLVAVLSLLGLVVLGPAGRPTWSPALVPVSRGPPSLR